MRQKISLHLSFPLDDSYTPSTLCIRAGTSLSDLQDVRIVTLDKPNGWITFDVSAELSDDSEGLCVHLLPTCYLTKHRSTSKPIYCYVLQIVVLANHVNGKDTHVRGLHVLGPMECVYSYAILCLNTNIIE